ncbi:YjjG family noncanonical pyrimidine nucleotidase [Paenibacillus sp. N3/727]|uniref:YjjG family noncanonical pyrimidine nucleotidase n=1 Tax=Paenibacillus sp. N3/727 TaxID=2925845 RepID=UPI001F52CD81|nr:YjjG family noncanonical pyrimidine nucleotidase [Paenibacillus sp. N3/727]UNK20572.1 YjjG family noncanonical pyrimidine nucleotidase [Paenibacillus sp. N3/727]
MRVNYKAIIFDLDNTLLDYDQSEQNCMKQALADHRLNDDLEWDEFWTVFGPINFKYWMDRNLNNHKIHQVLEHSFTDTFQALKRKNTEPQAISKTYWNLFCSTCHLEPNADAILESLHGQYKLGVISNGIGDAQRQRLKVGELYQYFDALIISDEVNCWKPDHRIFEHALEALDVRENEVLYIGDSLTDDYMGATNAGIDFCFYNGRGLTLQGDQNPKYMINDLMEIMKLLESGVKV